MSKFTFLTKKDIQGYFKLYILKKYGKKAAITDYAILLGGSVSEDHFASKGNTLKERAGLWWIKSASIYKDACLVDEEGNIVSYYLKSRNIGARPAIPYSSIQSISTNKVKNSSGILEVEYGEYPQTVVDEKNSYELEKAYNNGILKITGKNYTAESIGSQNTVASFNAINYTEYEYNESKYIRFVGNSNCDREVLSDGRKIEKGYIYWVRVEPIKWLVDEKADIALSKKIIFSGVQFDIFSSYNGDGYFDKTNIKQFIDKYFSKEIMPNKVYSQTTSVVQTQNIKKTNRNPYKFDFEEVSEEEIIKGAIESNISVFLHGRSSEGKSARVKQIDKDCVIIYLRNASPESLNGKSVYNQKTGEMIDVKPTWLKKLEEKCEKEPDKYHILFFDEITNALPSIQGIAFNIVLDKEVNGIWKLPENVRIVAAGNEMSESLSANKLAEPLFNRFAHVYIKTTTEKWLKWASENNIHPAIYSYIAYKNGEVLRSEYNGEKPNADPRKWEMASKMLYKTNKPEMLRALIGEEITKEFVAFCNQKVITLEDVIKGNYNEMDLQLNTAERYATTMGLTQVDEENVEKVREFVKKLGEEFTSVFDILWSKNDDNRLELISELEIKNNIKKRV